MSTRLQHTSIRASAGTGKTYQLANRYLALLLLQALEGGKSLPEKIVALTFTRKGAGEFAERILHRLAAAAADATERAKVQSELVQLVKGNPAMGVPALAAGADVNTDEATLRAALGVMIDEFDRVVMSTIDSFMARSVQTLAFELGLGGFEILEEAVAGREREALLGEVFRSAREKGLEEFYQTLKRALLKSSGSLRTELGQFVATYHELLHLLPAAGVWGGSGFWGREMPQPPSAEWKQRAAELARQAAAADFGHKQVAKSLAIALDWLSKRSLEGAAGKLPAWLDAGGQLAELWHRWPDGDWTFEYQKRPRTIPAAVMQPLRSILEAWLAAERAALAQKTAAIYEIISGFETLYDRLARRKGRLTFSDLPVLLGQNRDDDAARAARTALAFRWYQKFDHWLLDEFQDTSRVQWDVLKPWLDEAIQDAEGTKSVFVVGDTKQSIYGWRGGESRLFDELAIGYSGAFKEQIMTKSWRSRPAVLELVNRVCSRDNPALCDAEKFSPAALERWRYETHNSAEKLKSRPGYAAVLLAKKAEMGESDEVTGVAEAEGGGELTGKLAAQAQIIRAVLEKVQPLEKGLSCAILVRKNKNAQAVAQWLRANGVPQVMIEGDATLAEQSPLVAALVDALRWLATPAHTFAAGHVQLTPLWNVLMQPMKKIGEADIPEGRVWRHWHDRIAEGGAAQVTHEWCEALIDRQTNPYARYCLRHVSQAARQAGATLALPDWLALLEQLTVRETATAGSIHVMTIHKAKGLGFDVVFLPDLDTGTGGADSILIRRDERGRAIACLAYPHKWLQAWDAELGALCAAQQADRHFEDLCVLYVALTRAKEATFVILNKEKPRKASPAYDWILSALPVTSPIENPWGEGELWWEHGSREIDLAKKDAAAPMAAGAPPVTQLPPPQPRRKRRRPSEVGHESFAGVPDSASRSGQEFGTAVHAVFEQIEWWTPDQVLEGDADAVALVRRCLNVPEIRVLFTPEGKHEKALRELPVEFWERDTWWSGVVDRLVLRRDAENHLLKAVVIDFKTDAVETNDTLRARYAEQLTVYRRAVATALNIEVNQVELLLLSTHLGTLMRL